MDRILIIAFGLLFWTAAKSQTLQTVTTSGNFTTNTIRVGGQGNIGSSGSGEIVLGILNTPMSNDSRTFIGWKGDAATNTITNGPAGTLLLQGRSDLTYAPIDFATGSTTPQLRMRIAGNGNIAIGNNSLTPSSKLLISGSGNSSSTTSLLVQNSSNTEALRILDNGNIGLGIAAPVSKLHLAGSGTEVSAPIMILQNWIGVGLVGSLRFASGNGGYDWWSGIEAYATGGTDQQDLRFYSTFGSRGERMRITEHGTVAINTITPNANAKLDVNGNIYSNGKIFIGTPDANTPTKIAPYSLAVNGSAVFTKAVVKLNSAWPDYVFTQTYRLPKLDSLEQFIKLNGHLPEVPTSKEVEKKGIDLGSNQVLLLKKIEELTLFAIEQNKKTDKLQEIVQTQNKKIEEQSKRIFVLEKN